MQRRLKQAFTAIKEHGCVSYAKMVTMGGFCDLDLIVVKATSPDDLPLPERYVYELIKIFSFSPSSFRAFSLSFTRRFGKTQCWSRPENNPFRAELLCARTNSIIFPLYNLLLSLHISNSIPTRHGRRRNKNKKSRVNKKSPFFPFYSPSPARYFFSKKSPARPPSASENSTPRRLFRRPFPPPSPAKHIKAVLARRHGTVKPKNAAAIPEGEQCEGGDMTGLDRSFGFSKQFTSR